MLRARAGLVLHASIIVFGLSTCVARSMATMFAASPAGPAAAVRLGGGVTQVVVAATAWRAPALRRQNRRALAERTDAQRR